MTTKYTQADVFDLLPLFALGALEPDEMLAIDTYVQQSPTLQASLHAIEATMVQLAHSVPAAAPPIASRARLLARASADSQPPAPVQVQGSLPAATRRVHAPRRSGWVFVPLCAALLFVLLGTYAFQLRGEVAQLRAMNQQLQQALERNQHQFVLVAGASRRVAMASAAPNSVAGGIFYLNNDQGVFILHGLAVLPPDKTYQLWLVPPGGTPTSVGLVQATTSDTVALTVPVPIELRNFAIVDVSVEQAGGSSSITKETIVLRGKAS